MALAKITSVTGRAVSAPGDDIDTDRIIPARFMKCVTFDGLGEFLFNDVRKTPEGAITKHPLNDPKHAGATILISGNNFGCGSSREHAPQAIHKAGFRAVIAEGFAEIFFGNSTQLGIPCVSVSRTDRELLQAFAEANPQAEITVDLERNEVRYGDKKVALSIRPGARGSLIAGTWDPLGELLEASKAVDAVMARLPYVAKV
ncbi:MAG: 3-isopropylmalate dehydratase small subunit [Verrucomicrobiota bacterium]|nr:3-isopropylmalate dehydratase small subunit [Verrucomicrobiota bacterium]